MKDCEIQNKLRDHRTQKGLSQENLADALGISRQSVIALEQGKYMPSLPLVVSMCQFFNSAFEDIFEFEREVGEEISKVLEDDHQVKIINKPTEITGVSADSVDGKESNMTYLEPWRPLRDTVSLRDAMDRLLEDSFVTPAKVSTAGMPKIDIKEKKDSVVVKAELPGVAEEDVEVEIADSVMTISGEKRAETEEEKEGYYYKESHSGSFSRSFTLPSEVKAEKANAEMDGGVLTVTVPKVEAKTPKKVAVKKKTKK
jgi:HSP20 family protein